MSHNAHLQQDASFPRIHTKDLFAHNIVTQRIWIQNINGQTGLKLGRCYACIIGGDEYSQEEIRMWKALTVTPGQSSFGHKIGNTTKRSS